MFSHALIDSGVDNVSAVVPRVTDANDLLSSKTQLVIPSFPIGVMLYTWDQPTTYWLSDAEQMTVGECCYMG